MNTKTNHHRRAATEGRSRRAMLKALAVGGASMALPLFTAEGGRATMLGKPGAASPPVSRPPSPAPRLLAYLESLSRPDGGYAWEDQPDSHLTPTFAVIGCYRCCGNRHPPGKGWPISCGRITRRG